MTAKDIKAKLVAKDKNSIAPAMPTFKTNIACQPSVAEYLAMNNCTSAMLQGLVEVYYEPKDNRVLFEVNNGVGYVGRALDYSFPKWKNYGDTSCGFFAGHSKSVVLVEDCASACAVAATGNYTGMALLGTTVTIAHKEQLIKYDELLVCLDKDATLKAMKIKQELQGIIPTRIVPIIEDLKYETEETIMRILENE